MLPPLSLCVSVSKDLRTCVRSATCQQRRGVLRLLLFKCQAAIETATIRGLLGNLQNEFVRLGRGAPQEPHPSPARAHTHDLYRPLVRPPRRLNSGTSEILKPPWLTVQIENRAVVGDSAVGLDAVQGENLALGLAF